MRLRRGKRVGEGVIGPSRTATPIIFLKGYTEASQKFVKERE